MPSKRIRSVNSVTVSGGGGTVTVDPFTDTFTLNIVAAESNATPTEADTYAIALAQSESNATPTEALELKFPAGVWAETGAAPTDVNAITMRVWLSGSSGAGVTNPTNADGQNNGTVATISTAALGSNTETLTSLVGTSVPSVSVSAATYRGWFNLTINVGTSTGRVIAHSNAALFTDVTMFSANTSTNHSTGTFTFDLVAAGINTLAKVQSLEIYHQTQDLVAGVTQATMTVDAGAVELAGAF